MTTWSGDDLSTMADAEELDIASTRADGSLRPYVTIWAARVGDGLYVRSAFGPQNGWFRRAASSGAGRVRAGGIERDAAFAAPDPSVHAALDSAYRSKYADQPAEYVDPVVGELAASATLRVDPR